MCTSGSTDVLIIATNLGSLVLFDLKHIDSKPNSTLNYENLLSTQVQGWNEFDEAKRLLYYNRVSVQFSI